MCESGTCYFLDFHMALGGESTGSRTVLGDPDNDAAYGLESGTFFVYDPTVGSGGGQKDEDDNDDSGVLWAVVGVAGLVLLGGGAAYCVSQARRKARDLPTSPTTGTTEVTVADTANTGPSDVGV